MRGNVRDNLIERLQKPEEDLAIGSLTSSNVATTERRAILDQLGAKSLLPGTIANQPVRFFEALTHTNSKDFDRDYIFAVLSERVLPNLSQLNGLHRTAFRKALCHLDLIWYKAALT